MSATTSTFDNALKEVYLGVIRDQLNSKTRILNDFTKGDVSQYEWQGRSAILSLHSGRSNAVKAIAENGKLPTASRQGFAKLTVPMRFLEGSIKLSTQVIKASRADKGSFARAMDTEMKGITNDMARQRNRYLFGAGLATLALENGGGASAVRQVDTPGGVAGAANGVRFLKPGMVVAFHDFTVPTTVDAVRTIASVDSAVQITLTATATPDDNAVITLGTARGSVTEGSYGLEPVGLLGLADSTTYLSSIHGLDRSAAANAFFRSRVLTSAGAWSTDLINRVIDDTEEVSGELIDQMYAHYSVKREYLKTLESDRRYSSDGALRNPDGVPQASLGSKVDAKYAGLPIKAEKDAPYGTLIGVNKSHIFWVPEVEGEWMDEDGAILSRVADEEAFEATYRVWENFLCDQGNTLFRVDGLTATVSSGVYSD